MALPPPDTVKVSFPSSPFFLSRNNFLSCWCDLGQWKPCFFFILMWSSTSHNMRLELNAAKWSWVLITYCCWNYPATKHAVTCMRHDISFISKKKRNWFIMSILETSTILSIHGPVHLTKNPESVTFVLPPARYSHWPICGEGSLGNGTRDYNYSQLTVSVCESSRSCE